MKAKTGCLVWGKDESPLMDLWGRNDGESLFMDLVDNTSDHQGSPIEQGTE